MVTLTLTKQHRPDRGYEGETTGTPARLPCPKQVRVQASTKFSSLVIGARATLGAVQKVLNACLEETPQACLLSHVTTQKVSTSRSADLLVLRAVTAWGLARVWRF